MREKELNNPRAVWAVARCVYAMSCIRIVSCCLRCCCAFKMHLSQLRKEAKKKTSRKSSPLDCKISSKQQEKRERERSLSQQEMSVLPRNILIYIEIDSHRPSSILYPNYSTQGIKIACLQRINETKRTN